MLIYFSGWEESFLQSVLDGCDNGSFFSADDQFCEDFVTFRDLPKIGSSCGTLESNLAKVQAIQPPPLDMSTITDEVIDGVMTLPRGEGTGTLKPPGPVATLPPRPTLAPIPIICDENGEDEEDTEEGDEEGDEGDGDGDTGEGDDEEEEQGGEDGEEQEEEEGGDEEEEEGEGDGEDDAEDDNEENEEGEEEEENEEGEGEEGEEEEEEEEGEDVEEEEEGEGEEEEGEGFEEGDEEDESQDEEGEEIEDSEEEEEEEEEEGGSEEDEDEGQEGDEDEEEVDGGEEGDEEDIFDLFAAIGQPCHDNDGTHFINNRLGEKSCAWISIRPLLAAKLCSVRDDIAMACLETCGQCFH